MGLAIGTCICCGGGGRTKQAQIAAQDAEAPVRAAVAADSVADQLARREATELGRDLSEEILLEVLDDSGEKVLFIMDDVVNDNACMIFIVFIAYVFLRQNPKTSLQSHQIS
eukprot:COSAG05_NODE_3877_length_1794_cov_1.487316_2_plen_112_part_00